MRPVFSAEERALAVQLIQILRKIRENDKTEPQKGPM